MHLLRVLVCGDDASGRTTLAARLNDAPGRDHRRIAIADMSEPRRSTQVLATEAMASDIALMVVDARSGVTFETRRQAHLLLVLGLGRVVLALNRMDRVAYSEATFTKAQQECAYFAARIAPLTCVPVSADGGENVEHLSAQMPWYTGPTLLQCLESVYGSDSAPASRLGPPKHELATQFEATIVWTADRPMLQSRSYLMSIATTTVPATVAPLKHRVDSRTLQHVPAKTLDCGDVGVCNLELSKPIGLDPDGRRFTLLDHQGGETVGVGLLHFALHRSQNVRWQALDINKDARAALMGQKPCVVWFTGLSGAGKSTIANLVEKRLHALGRHTYLLDGDNVRLGLNKDLGFTDADRVENIRRVAEVARLMVDAGLVVLVSFISPFRSERRMARTLFAEGEFVEVFVDTPLEVAESRDPKGLYRKARRGDLRNFTGVDSPYEIPEHPEVRLDTVRLTVEDSALAVLSHLKGAGVLM